MHRVALAAVVFGLCYCLSGVLQAQSTNASITGYVTDPTKAIIVDAKVIAINVGTNARYEATTNETGSYNIANLPPASYRVEVEKAGFKTVVKSDIVLHVQDAIAINFEMAVGSASETITVEGGAPLVNTSDASVSTVVDRRFAENVPLNGRSFQTLIELTPGVVLTPVSSTEQGQFSVNGQRANANYFSVDGVSANIGVGSTTGGFLLQGASGALPGLNAVGGTQSLVSVDAMQEFRVQTSSFAPEFGRTPGGQISIATRSGTNQFHVAFFEYLRNDVLDANDWFSNRSGLGKPKDRQNDFGGVFGGPVVKDGTFFFFSYEGLRLRQPLTQVTVVPSTDSLTGRQTAVPQMQPFLNAYPIPNGANLGNGFAQFNASYSDTSTLDAYSLRLDHTINSKLSLFGRWSYTPSETTKRGVNGFTLNNIALTPFTTQTVTVGLTGSITANISNETRANYSNARAGSSFRLDNFGGAVPLPESLMFPSAFSSANSLFEFLIIGGGFLEAGANGTNEQRQVNIVDNLSVTGASHRLRFGVDYRWLAPFTRPQAYLQEPIFSGMTSPSGALSGVPLQTAVIAQQSVALLLKNLSAYGQDTWKVTPRLTLTYGLRWEVNPALKGKNPNSQPFTVQGLSNPATMTLAQRGTPVYRTTYGNVAPRIGVAYELSERQGWNFVLRGGFGVFYDLGSGSLGRLTGGFPFTAPKVLASVPFPLTPQQAAPTVFSLRPPANLITVADPNLILPRTYQWNAAFEQQLGANQTASITYVGAVGRNLLRQDDLRDPPTLLISQVFVTRNTATSDYHAMQLKFQRRLSRGLQALASYTWSHSIDIASNDSGLFNIAPALATPNLDRGNSDFDVRHALTGAVSYDVPALRKQGVLRAILTDWSLDSLITARSALPVSVIGPTFIVAGTQFQSRPNIVSGIPLYLFGPQYPGGKILNNTPNQGGTGCEGPFCAPPSGQQGSLGRNVLRGFGAWQTDFTLRRRFRMSEGLSLEFRSEFFNIFNHPNFGNPVNTLSSPLFGQSTQTLASSLSSGGTNGGALNQLYQTGGPRSIQLALRLTF